MSETTGDRADRADRRDDGPEEGSESSGGEVSEVSGMDEAGAGQPIMPDQATAGAPDSESGEVQEGEAGPDAVPRGNREENRK